MGELSEEDKKVLLGPDYKTQEKRRETRSAAQGKRTSMSGSLQSTFAFIAIVALLIFFGDYFRPAAGRQPSLEIVALIVFAVSTLSFTWLWRQKAQREHAARR